MLDTKVAVFTMDYNNEPLGAFNLSDEQIRLLDWLNEKEVFDDSFEYTLYNSVEDM